MRRRRRRSRQEEERILLPFQGCKSHLGPARIKFRDSVH
jgi:hypothetical protein